MMIGKTPSENIDRAMSLFNSLKGPEEKDKEEGVKYWNEPNRISRMDFEEICFALNWNRIKNL